LHSSVVKAATSLQCTRCFFNCLPTNISTCKRTSLYCIHLINSCFAGDMHRMFFPVRTGTSRTVAHMSDADEVSCTLSVQCCNHRRVSQG
jgi:hypothetical protein